MDDKRCPRSNFPCLPSPGARSDPLITESKKCTGIQKRRGHSRGVKYPGDIVYVKNPLFDNVKCSKSFPRSKERSNFDDRFPKIFFPSLDYRCNTANLQSQASSPRSRKDRMKARAESRRDSLIDQSSDEDYSSSINSSSDLRSGNSSNRDSSNMEDAYNRRSRAARTERYFRRLSKEENFHETYDFNNSVLTRKTQDARPPLGRAETQLFSPPPSPHQSGNLKEKPSLVFYKRDIDVLNKPLYNSLGIDSPAFGQYRRCEVDKPRSQSRRLEIPEKRGSSLPLAYKNYRFTQAIDPVPYAEPKISNYRDSEREIYPQNQPARPVQRSYSFQSEVPREYDTTTWHKAQGSDKLGSQKSRIDRKWIDSITSSASTNSNPLSSGDSPRSKLYSPRELSGGANKHTSVENLAKTRTYDSSSSNLFSALTENKIPVVKRSSKDLGKELSELEKMYTSLRLSDDNLLERAEERCVEEFSLKGIKAQCKASETSKYLAGSSSSESIEEDGNFKGEKNEADVVNDDMAYRKMQSKQMPALSETQNSLSQISYLLASSALILDKNNEYPEIRDEEADEEPNITKDDMVYRNLHYANNVLRVVEPQPPFGIPLRPATPSTNSNYLCSSPVALKSPPLKYVPESEPNLVTDDLAFRNLRKDAPKTPPSSVSGENGNQVNISVLKNELDTSLSDDKFFRKKKKAVRSLSANLYGLINDVKSLELNIK